MTQRLRRSAPSRVRIGTALLVGTVIGTAVLGVAGCGSDDVTKSADVGQTGHSTATLPKLDPDPIADNPLAILPVTVHSFDGKDVTVVDTSRIVAVDRYGTFAQTVYALGLGAHLVGRSTAAAFPAVDHVTNVTPSGETLNIEGVANLRPTVILTDSSVGTDAVREQLGALGAPVVYFDPARTVAGVGAEITAVAQALGVPEQGKALAKRTSDEIAEASKAKPASAKSPRVAFLYLRGPLTMIAGPGSGADAIIAALGGQDAGTASGLKQPFMPITSEAIVAAAPDVFLTMTDGLKSIGGPDALQKLPGIAQTPAGRNKRVVDMDDSVLLSFGPNTGHVLKALGAALYSRGT